MATRGVIALKEANKFYAIYSHWDNYPERLVPILNEHYNTKERVEELINHGDASYLAENIGEHNGFDDTDYHVCLFYHRDRHEPYETVAPKIFKTFYDLRKYAKQVDAEWLYIFENGIWYVYDIVENEWFSDEELDISILDFDLPVQKLIQTIDNIVEQYEDDDFRADLSFVGNEYVIYDKFFEEVQIRVDLTDFDIRILFDEPFNLYDNEIHNFKVVYDKLTKIVKAINEYIENELRGGNNE